MPKPYGLTLAGLDYTNAAKDEFNDWYDTEHIPQRRIQGILNAHRWIAVDNPRVSIVTYDMDSIDVRDSAAYRAINPPNQTPWSERVRAKCKRVCHFVAEQILPGRTAAPQGAGALLLHAVNVPDEAAADFNAWCIEEHIPRLAKVPGCVCARSYKVRNGVQGYLHLFHLSSPEVQASTAWKAAFATPRSAKMGALFKDELRILTRPYVRQES